MLRLFMLKDRRGGKPLTDQFGDVVFFDNKTIAKRARDRIGNGCAVAYGPDHKHHGKCKAARHKKETRDV